MEDSRQFSFKRRPNPVFEKSGNKRGKFGNQFSENSHDSETIYRILCHYKRIGSVIGKGGGIVKALREETQSKITVAESVPGSEEREIIIHSYSTKKAVKQNIDNNMELQCAAQDALLKVHDKIVEEEIVGYNEAMVTARLLVPNNTVGCILGKNGDVIKRLRRETGASVRVLPADQLPVCAMTTDELVQISGKPAIAKRALYEVSTLLHQNLPKDKPPPGIAPMSNLPSPANPMWSERGGAPMRFRGVDFDDGGGETLAEFSMKILCPRAKIGGVIGKGGSNVRQVQQETGTDIHVDDVSGDSDERVIHVSSFEGLWNPRSRTIDAILLLQDQTSDHSEKGMFTTRLLIPASKVGCILGQGGRVINDMRWRTKADIHVFSKEEKPKFAGVDEELVQVSGSYDSAKDALAEIASRYRTRCLRDAKPLERPSTTRGGGRSGGHEPPTYPPLPRDHEPYTGHLGPPRELEPYTRHLGPPRDLEPFTRHSGPPRDLERYNRHSGPPRDHEPYSGHSGPPRDHEPYSHPAPPWVYEPEPEPRSHPAPPWEYEPRGYRAPPRDYEPNDYPAPPPMEYEPRGYTFPSPTSRDSEHQGYPLPPNATGFLGGTDLKMPSSGRGYATGHEAGNTNEITGTRLKLQDPFAGGGSESTYNTYQGYGRQKRPLQSSYSDNYAPQQSSYNDNYAPQQEPYPDINPSPTPYRHYQNNPPQQGHYLESPYKY